MLAWKMGLPVGRFIVASNANDVIPQFLATAHAAKFSEVINEAFQEYSPQTDWKITIPDSLAAAMGKPKAFTSMDNNLNALEEIIVLQAVTHSEG
ncbi:MAG: hypothetical protein ACI3ZS_09610 [Candidatus Cryptobacteroides sp.]